MAKFFPLGRDATTDFVYKGRAPLGAIEIDWDHPMARGLAFAWYNGINHVDKTASKPVNAFGSTLTSRGVDRNGPYWRSNSLTDGGWETLAPTLHRKLDGTFFISNVLGAAINTLDSSASITTIPAFTTSWASPFVYMKFGSNGAGVTPRFYFYDGGSLRDERGSSAMWTEDDVYHVYAVDKNDTTTMNFYQDGDITSSNTASVNDNVVDVTPGHRFVHMMSRNTTAADEGAIGNIYFNYVYNRQLTQQDLKSIQRDPWQFFISANNEVFYRPTAGGATTVNLTGQAVTAGQGTPTATGAAETSITGQESTAQQGALNVSIGVTVVLAGQESTSQQGIPTAIGAASTTLTGQEITAALGTPTAIGAANTILTGQEITSGQGAVTVDITGQTVVEVTGQAITAGQGTPTATGAAITSLAGQAATAQQGTLSVDLSVVVNLTGQQINSGQGSISLSTANIITLNGQEVTAGQGVVSVSIPDLIATSGVTIKPVLQNRIMAPHPVQRIITAKR